QMFAIGAVLSLPKNQPAGDLVVPAKLRYQACDANLCYPPATADAQWTIHVDPNAAPGAATDAVFATIKWGTGEKASANPAINLQSAISNQQSGNPLAKLDQFAILGTSGGYLNADEFL